MSEYANPVTTGSLNLEQQKKRAKELLKQFNAAQVEAVRRFQHYHPKIQRHPEQIRTFQPQLSDAQLAIARENGLTSWPKLKAHIEQLEQERRAIATGASAAPDGDRKTLHLRCGSDIHHGLRLAGFTGDFLEFADPYCQGPIIDDSDLNQFLQQRAAFIAAAYGIELRDARTRFEQEYRQLHTSHRYTRVVLWFEHDSYDQLILAYVLHHFHQATAQPERLELICIDTFPGIRPFLGLGQLPPEALRSLWRQRQPVSSHQLQTAHQVWQALTAPSPEALHQIAIAGTPAIPPLANALRRHLLELPWLEDGLSLTERLTLQILAEHSTIPQKGTPAITAGQLFKQLTLEKDPLPYLGDSMYWQVLATLNDTPHPPFELLPETASLPWPKRQLQLNDIGKALLNQSAHWLQLNAINRWVGGVHLCHPQPIWCWDGQHSQPVLRP